MANDPSPSGDNKILFSEFHDITESAGAEMKTALQEVRERTSDDEGYIMFEMKDHKEILKDTVEMFESKIFAMRHPERRLAWIRGYYTIRATRFDESALKKIRHDVWWLTLSVEGADSCGESFNLHERARFQRHGFYLAYIVS